MAKTINEQIVELQSENDRLKKLQKLFTLKTTARNRLSRGKLGVGKLAPNGKFFVGAKPLHVARNAQHYEATLEGVGSWVGKPTVAPRKQATRRAAIGRGNSFP